MTVTFFGHRDAPEGLELKLKEVLCDLIENSGVKRFYVGNNGAFDRIVYSVLGELKLIYPHISCTTVFAYMPTSERYDNFYVKDSILPQVVAASHPRYAICARNKWMIDQSDLVITYVRRRYGGAARFRKMAVSKGKKIIDL